MYQEQSDSFGVNDTGAPVGADIAGIGEPNLVIKEYSDGAHWYVV